MTANPEEIPVYTIVTLYPDYATNDYGADVFIQSAPGNSPQEAARAVQRMAAEDAAVANPTCLAEDFRVIAVFEGECIVALNAISFEESSRGKPVDHQHQIARP